MNDQTIQKRYGVRRTKARDAALCILREAGRPVDATELLQLLARKQIVVNKTTVFRMLEEFLESHIVTRHEFGEGKYRYEYAESSHHHHIVCTACKVVQELPNCTLDAIPIQGALSSHFTITHHSLEFFGICQNCQKSRSSL